jgi:type IV pilus assembly protein PilC
MKNLQKSKCYSWAGISKSGKPITGEIIAETLFQAKLNLYVNGIKVRRIRKKIGFIRKKTQPSNLALFLRQLSLLLQSGVPMIQACEILLAQNNIILKSLIATLKTKIESGSPLSQSLKLFPQYFDFFVCHLIFIGEQTGKIEDLLLRAAKHMEKKVLLKKQIIQALFYPAIISMVALIVTLVMLIVIVPRFAEIFQSMHHELPVFTKIIIFFSNLLRNIYWLPLIPIITALFFYYRYISMPAFQIFIQRFILKLPYLGNALNKVLLARFTENLATLFNAGITISDALKLLIDSTNNITYRKIFQQIRYDIAKGMQLHIALQNHSFFPPLMTQMIKVGEESGQLATMLEKITLLFEEEVQSFITYLNLLLEPLIMVILGVLIGGLVIAMYLPIFKLGTIF